jgi:hypothetical protein
MYLQATLYDNFDGVRAALFYSTENRFIDLANF